MFYQHRSILSGLFLDQNNHENCSPNQILLSFLTSVQSLAMSWAAHMLFPIYSLLPYCQTCCFSMTEDIYNVRAAKAVSIKSLQYFHLFPYSKCGGALDCILYCICIKVLAPCSGSPAGFCALNHARAGKRYKLNWVCKAILRPFWSSAKACLPHLYL